VRDGDDLTGLATLFVVVAFLAYVLGVFVGRIADVM